MPSVSTGSLLLLLATASASANSGASASEVSAVSGHPMTRPDARLSSSRS
jgi:hypothetical protein